MFDLCDRRFCARRALRRRLLIHVDHNVGAPTAHGPRLREGDEPRFRRIGAGNCISCHPDAGSVLQRRERNVVAFSRATSAGCASPYVRRVSNLRGFTATVRVISLTSRGITIGARVFTIFSAVYGAGETDRALPVGENPAS